MAFYFDDNFYIPDDEDNIMLAGGYQGSRRGRGGRACRGEYDQSRGRRGRGRPYRRARGGRGGRYYGVVDEYSSFPSSRASTDDSPDLDGVILFDTTPTLEEIVIKTFQSLRFDDAPLALRQLKLYDRVVIHSPDRLYHGVLKWSGIIDKKQCAGIELNEDCSVGTDGQMGDTVIFSSANKRAIVIPVHLVSLDSNSDDINHSLNSIIVRDFKTMKLDDSFLEDRGLFLKRGVVIKLRKGTFKGILKWVGILDYVVCAGIELDKSVDFGCNGSCSGVKIFQAGNDRGVFVPLRYVEYDPTQPAAAETNSSSNIGDQLECRVCMDKQVSIFLIPCGHICVCEPCSRRLSDCPICQKHIQQKKRCYFP